MPLTVSSDRSGIRCFAQSSERGGVAEKSAARNERAGEQATTGLSSITRVNRSKIISRSAKPPIFVAPMLARPIRELPEGKQWAYEAKLDGYRIEAVKHGGEVRLFSRRGNDFTKRFAPVVAAVTTIKTASALLDGEVVAVDEKGQGCNT
jgi:bifunctional non-homologous end joining protein LigD